MDTKHFYNSVRQSLFGGKLTSLQVVGMEAIIAEFEARKWTDMRKLAYIFSTIFHETGVVIDKVLVRTMQPVEEMGKGKGRKYGKCFWYNGTPYTDITTIFYGRGHTQNTWRDVYLKLSTAAKKQGKNWDFVAHPDLLLQMEPSIWATFTAMESGLYTGAKLQRYFNEQVTDPINARKIINGTDKAELIAGYYHKFLAALSLP